MWEVKRRTAGDHQLKCRKFTEFSAFKNRISGYKQAGHDPQVLDSVAQLPDLSVTTFRQMLYRNAVIEFYSLYEASISGIIESFHKQLSFDPSLHSDYMKEALSTIIHVFQSRSTFWGDMPLEEEIKLDLSELLEGNVPDRMPIYWTARNQNFNDRALEALLKPFKLQQSSADWIDLNSTPNLFKSIHFSVPKELIKEITNLRNSCSHGSFLDAIDWNALTNLYHRVELMLLFLKCHFTNLAALYRLRNAKVLTSADKLDRRIKGILVTAHTNFWEEDFSWIDASNPSEGESELSPQEIWPQGLRKCFNPNYPIIILRDDDRFESEFCKTWNNHRFVGKIIMSS